MIPVLFHIGPLKIHSFGFMLAVAFLLIAMLASREFVRRGYSADAAGSCVLGAMIGGVLGAKLYFLLDHWGDMVRDPMGMIFSGSGLTYYGGLFGGALGVIIGTWKYRIPIGRLADLGAPFIALGYAVGRVGCFLNGDDYGKPTGVPWGMTFPKGTPATTVPVHPTQLYEVVAGGLILAFLWLTRKRLETRPGRVMGVYLLLAGTERFTVEFWRSNPPVALGLTVAQWISVGLFLLGLLILAVASVRSGAPAPARG